MKLIFRFLPFDFEDGWDEYTAKRNKIYYVRYYTKEEQAKYPGSYFPFETLIKIWPKEYL